MKEKLQTLLAQLNHGLVEREDTLKAALLTVLAGENLVLIGPPGTGKSLIARRIAEALAHGQVGTSDSDYFEYLLTKFSTPEEIFGPLSIAELKADRFKRNTAGYLPTVKIAFLDEIFKASSSILNALLTILNERIYHNGAEPQRVPLQGLIAASNELPTDQEELSALYDRFLVRIFVDYVSPDNLPRLFENTDDLSAFDTISSAELVDIRQAAAAVTMPPNVAKAIQRIWGQHKESFKEDRRETLSDRRLKKVIGLMRVSAATNGRHEVDLSDVFLLKNCLWNHPDNALKVRDIIFNTLRAGSGAVPQAAGAVDAPGLSQPIGQPGKTVVKGYKGSGTAHDPLLIENVHDLMGLESAKVGQQGYYFRQTADIDCTQLSSWMNIDFKGHYDGGGHSIKRTKWNKGEAGYLFCNILAESRIHYLKLEGLGLAVLATGSRITDCLVQSPNDNGTLQNQGWIFGRLEEGCEVERCYLTGSVALNVLAHRAGFGIARDCLSSSIKHCALGIVNRGGFLVTGTPDIVLSVDDACILGYVPLENNIIIDTISKPDHSPRFAKIVPAALFVRSYFEHHLGWDFDTVWQWDDAKGQPVLRSVGLGAASTSPTPEAATPADNMTDELTQQMHANIWL